MLAAGWDPRYGTRLRSDLGAAGLVEVESEHFGRIAKGGSPNARLLGLTLERNNVTLEEGLKGKVERESNPATGIEQTKNR